MGSPPSIDLPALLGRVARGLREAEIPFMIIGGQAVLIHGEPRLTQDIDVTLGVSPADGLDALMSVVKTLDWRVLPDDASAFVRDTFVLPVEDPVSQLRVDFIFSSIPYERHAIERAIAIDVDGTPVPFAAAEDLLLYKIFAGRPRDLDDARGIVARVGRTLDWGYLERWAATFAEIPGREELPQCLASLRADAEQP